MSDLEKKLVHPVDDGITRCWRGKNHLDLQDYYDEEWDCPVADDFQLFEKKCLAAFQSGLSWLTILRKHENFQEAFAGFNFHKIASYDEEPLLSFMNLKQYIFYIS